MPWRELIRRTAVDATRDGIAGLAAQLAFYFFLALFPALLVIVSLLGYLPIEARLEQLLGRVEGMLPGGTVEIVRQELDRVLAGDRRGVITLGLAGALWSSSAATTAVIYTLNRAYDIEEWRPWWKTRLLAIALTIALAIFVVAALALVLAGGDLGSALWSLAGAGGDSFERVWLILQWPLAIALVVAGVDLVYYFAPNADSRWAWITPGSLLATALWLGASIGFKLYLRYVSDIGVIYGAIGSVIVMLLWLYLSALALLIGAELNAEIDKALPTRDRSPQGPGRRRRIGPAADRAAV